MIDYSHVEVSATPEIVHSFIQANRATYLEHLHFTQSRISTALKNIGVYKIYGREERQQGESFKDPRKIRLKFNRYHIRSGSSHGSLWDVPDIVGFTIVVSYPSEISSVAAIVDHLIDQGEFIAENPPEPTESDPDGDIISSKHGRAFKKRGYFACHYNLRKRGPNPKKAPICEVQIKTILFDAWGAKTHDLTYKTSSEANETLVQSFELLGDTLAVLDLQSDTLRRGIKDQQSVREHHLRSYIDLKSRSLLDHALEQLRLPKTKRAIFQRIDAGTNFDDLQIALREAESMFNSAQGEDDSIPEYDRIAHTQKWASIALFCSAVRSENKRFTNEAREYIAEWINRVKNPVAKIHALGVSGMVNLFALDIVEAINETQQAIEIAVSISNFSSVEEEHAFRKRMISIYSSQSYYYTLLIGSHDGREMDAVEKARENREAYLNMRDTGEAIEIDEICTEETLLDFFSKLPDDRTPSVFMALDTLLFVCCCVAEEIGELKKAHRALQRLHEKTPPQLVAEAQVLFEFHDYCARSRLAELEKAYFGSSQS